jgi:hypothetical protein
MKLLTITLALYSLASVILPSSVAHNGSDLKSTKVTRNDQALILDADWTYFVFTNVDVAVSPNFIVTTSTLPLLSQLQIVDLYCDGDVFQIFNNGDELLLTTSEPYGTDCKLHTSNATLAFSQHYWSKGILHLNTSTAYNMTLYPTASPWTAGKAAIRWITSLF